MVGIRMLLTWVAVLMPGGILLAGPDSDFGRGLRHALWVAAVYGLLGPLGLIAHAVSLRICLRVAAERGYIVRV